MRGPLQAALPVLLILAGALGYWAATVNPFNPLQLQNPVTTWAQLDNIGLYYLALLPFFFFAGLYVSLAFVLNAARVERTYAYDLTGAGAGAAAALGLMYVRAPVPSGAGAAGAAGVGGVLRAAALGRGRRWRSRC